MLLATSLIGLILCAPTTARDVEAVMDRPLTLPAGAFDLTVHGTYTNWSIPGFNSIDGETVAIGGEFGATNEVQLGLGIAFPVNPGAAFGSLLGSVAIASGPSQAFRLDAGYERIGVNGDAAGTNSHANRYFAGVGARIRMPLSPTLAFVTGRTGAVHFGHFNNVGDSGTGLYVGGSAFSELASDFLVFGGGDNNSATNVGINLPAGLLLQPDPHFALTLLAGYSTVILFPSSGTTQSLHFIPIGLEAVVTPTGLVDLGLRFLIDGFVAQTSGDSGGRGYFDQRALMFWVRVHG